MTAPILVGLVDYGPAKAYVRDKFWEMYRECIAQVPGVDLAVVSDRDRGEWDDFGGTWISIDVPAKLWCEDILIPAHQALRAHALGCGYEKLLWQGIDALWQTQRDFERVATLEGDIVAPLICGRSDSMLPVARRFRPDGSQDAIPRDELESGEVIMAGFPGADNAFLSRAALTINVDDHIHWHDRINMDQVNLCYEEFVCYRAWQKGLRIQLDTGVKVWHVHEDNWGRMYPGMSLPLRELVW